MSRIYFAIRATMCSTTHYVAEHDYAGVYEWVFKITKNHIDSANASSWCELAGVGEVYETNLFRIEIIED